MDARRQFVRTGTLSKELVVPRPRTLDTEGGAIEAVL
jgi:hypothetical protein